MSNDHSLVWAIHTAVKGRARYKIAGLYQQTALKRYLECRLSQEAIIAQVRANQLTGNILVIFHPDFSADAIALLLQNIVLDYRKQTKKLAVKTIDINVVPETAKNLPTQRQKLTQPIIPAAEQQSSPGHLLAADAVMAKFKTSTTANLLSAASEENLKQYRLSRFIEPFKSLPVVLFTVGAGLSIVTGRLATAVVMLGVAVANVAIGSAMQSQVALEKSTQPDKSQSMASSATVSQSMHRQLNQISNQLVLVWGGVGVLVLGTVLLHTLGFDRGILLAIQQLHSPLLDRILLAITFLGDPATLLLICLGLAIGPLYARRRTAATTLGITAIGTIGCNYWLKVLFGRARPALWERLIDVGLHSFPSGHAMVSVATYGFLGYSLAKQFPQRQRQISGLTAILIGAIGFSRLYLGVHWPTDIAAGYAIGLAWLIACIWSSQSSVARTVWQEEPTLAIAPSSI